MPNKDDLFGSAALSTPEAYAFSLSLPTNSLTGGGNDRVVVGAVAEGSSIAWKFYGTGGANKVGTARLWGMSEVKQSTFTEYLGDYLCELDLTIGATVVPSSDPASDILPASNLVDTIAIKADHSHLPGVRVLSTGFDSAAYVVLDGFGYKYYILEIKNGDASGFGAMYRTF